MCWNTGLLLYRKFAYGSVSLDTKELFLKTTLWFRKIPTSCIARSLTNIYVTDTRNDQSQNINYKANHAVINKLRCMYGWLTSTWVLYSPPHFMSNNSENILSPEPRAHIWVIGGLVAVVPLNIELSLFIIAFSRLAK